MNVIYECGHAEYSSGSDTNYIERVCDHCIQELVDVDDYQPDLEHPHAQASELEHLGDPVLRTGIYFSEADEYDDPPFSAKDVYIDPACPGCPDDYPPIIYPSDYQESV